MRSRPLLTALAVAALIALAAGCGDDSSGSTGSEVAELAPPRTPIFVEGVLRPTGELKSNTEAAAERIAGIDNLGDFVVSELESSAEEDGEQVDFDKEVEPWLGERAAVFFERLEDDDPTGLGIVVESTDPDATQKFIDAQVEKSDEPYESGSYEGVDYQVGGDEDNAIAVVGDFLAIGEDEKILEGVVDASEGDSLASEDTFSEAISAASEGSLADVYVDVGRLIEQSGGQIDPQARQVLQNAGIDPSEATAVASVVPGSDQITVEFSSDLAGREAPTGEASELLGSLPGNAFAGFAISGFGDQVDEAIDSLDEEGIPDAVPPNQLKKGLKQLGIDLEALSASLEDAGVFAVGNSERSLGGALVLTTKGSGGTEAVSNIADLLRGVQVEGVTPLRGQYSGFSVRDREDLGDKPLVVAAKQDWIAIGYGLPATLSGLLAGTASEGKTLADNPVYDEAVSALGDTPIAGFADGPAALRLADSLISAGDEDFEGAKKYLRSIRFLALGSVSQEDLATAKLIIGLK